MLGPLDLGIIVLPAPKLAERPPMVGVVAGLPIVGERSKLVGVMVLCGELADSSTLPRCFAFVISAIQAGCGGAVGGENIFGDSGLLMAFSSQLDF